MNIDNDQHVLRNLMVSFYQAKIKKPKIIYCYFTDQERVDFEEQYESVITFGEDLNTYARGIEVLFIKTENILNEYFSKKYSSSTYCKLIHRNCYFENIKVVFALSSIHNKNETILTLVSFILLCIYNHIIEM